MKKCQVLSIHSQPRNIKGENIRSMWIITTLSSLFSANLHNNASILILDISNKCGTSGCNQTCTNIVDSYICSCFDGYVLDADGHSCNGKVYI